MNSTQGKTSLVYLVQVQTWIKMTQDKFAGNGIYRFQNLPTNQKEAKLTTETA